MFKINKKFQLCKIKFKHCNNKMNPKQKNQRWNKFIAIEMLYLQYLLKI